MKLKLKSYSCFLVDVFNSKALDTKKLQYLDPVPIEGYIKRAKPEKLKEIFNKYASIERDGEKFMSPEDFIRNFLRLYPNDDYNVDSVHLLASAVDIEKAGRISYKQFQAYEGLLCHIDALYKTIFQMFNTSGSGKVSFSEFAEVTQKTEFHKKISNNLNSPYIEHYFGKNKDKTLSYSEFCQLLHAFCEERLIDSFAHADRNGSGYISAHDFQDIMTNTRSHHLTDQVKSYLVEAVTLGQTSRQVSFAHFIAFNSLLNNMELVKQIYLHTTGGKITKEVPKEHFMYSAQMMSQMSPLEVDMLFHLSQLINKKTRINYNDLNHIAPAHFFPTIGVDTVSPPRERGILMSILESFYRFSFGFLAGGFAAAVVFPIDLMKTRIQNQRKMTSHKEALYKGYVDCFMKIIRREGVRGLYRGLLPQVIGVSPEKAIKLTVNDFVRDKFYDEHGNIKLYAEVLAGGCAGCCQVIVTNPLEIVKIRLQTAGEVADGHKIKARNIIRELGIFGLYKGVRACLVRDITFASIYFSSYANFKRLMADETGYNHPLSVLAAGTCAGVPAAALATPADVVKTRIQVVARAGQTTYKGVIDAATKIMKEEGPRAFLKGALARVCRSSPQLGITLFTYELLQRFLFVDFGGRAVAGSAQAVSREYMLKHVKPDHVGGYSVAVPVFMGIETKFGISLPKFRVVKPSPE